MAPMWSLSPLRRTNRSPNGPLSEPAATVQRYGLVGMLGPTDRGTSHGPDPMDDPHSRQARGVVDYTRAERTGTAGTSFEQRAFCFAVQSSLRLQQKDWELLRRSRFEGHRRAPVPSGRGNASCKFAKLSHNPSRTRFALGGPSCSRSTCARQVRPGPRDNGRHPGYSNSNGRGPTMTVGGRESTESTARIMLPQLLRTALRSRAGRLAFQGPNPGQRRKMPCQCIPSQPSTDS